MLSPTRFLYHTVGPVYLIRWSQDSGHSVLPLTGEQVAEHLKLDVEALRAQPMRLAQVRRARWACKDVCAVLRTAAVQQEEGAGRAGSAQVVWQPRPACGPSY